MLNLPASISSCFVAVWQMAAEGQSDKKDVWYGNVYEAKGIPEFFHAEKMASANIYWRLLNIYGDQRSMLAQSSCGWYVSAILIAIWKKSHTLDGLAYLSYHKMKSIYQCFTGWFSPVLWLVRWWGPMPCAREKRVERWALKKQSEEEQTNLLN